MSYLTILAKKVIATELSKFKFSVDEHNFENVLKLSDLGLSN